MLQAARWRNDCSMRRAVDCQDVLLFADARSTPPRIAAVVMVDGAFKYCDMEPPSEVMECFMARGDRQITSLEILSIACGICTFASEVGAPFSTCASGWRAGACC